MASHVGPETPSDVALAARGGRNAASAADLRGAQPDRDPDPEGAVSKEIASFEWSEGDAKSGFQSAAPLQQVEDAARPVAEARRTTRVTIAEDESGTGFKEKRPQGAWTAEGESGSQPPDPSAGSRAGCRRPGARAEAG